MRVFGSVACQRSFRLEPYDYRIWIMILLVTLHGVAITVFVFEYLQKTLTSSLGRRVGQRRRRAFVTHRFSL